MSPIDPAQASGSYGAFGPQPSPAPEPPAAAASTAAPTDGSLSAVAAALPAQLASCDAATLHGLGERLERALAEVGQARRDILEPPLECKPSQGWPALAEQLTAAVEPTDALLKQVARSVSDWTSHDKLCKPLYTGMLDALRHRPPLEEMEPWEIEGMAAHIAELAGDRPELVRRAIMGAALTALLETPRPGATPASDQTTRPADSQAEHASADSAVQAIVDHLAELREAVHAFEAERRSVRFLDEAQAGQPLGALYRDGTTDRLTRLAALRLVDAQASLLTEVLDVVRQAETQARNGRYGIQAGSPRHRLAGAQGHAGLCGPARGQAGQHRGDVGVKFPCTHLEEKPVLAAHAQRHWH
jgi:hypothetical protein